MPADEVRARIFLILDGGPQLVARAGSSVFRVFGQVRSLLLDLPGNVLRDARCLPFQIIGKLADFLHR